MPWRRRWSLGDRAGLAASLQGFMQMTIGALAAFLVGQFHDGSALPMAVTIAVRPLSLAARVFLLACRATLSRRES